jgi:hypothetical protein
MGFQKKNYLHLYKWPISEPHGATRQQAIVKAPVKWFAYNIPSAIVVFAALVFKV